MSKLKELVNRQAEDDALWFQAQTATEAYLQQALRALHAAVEGAAVGGEPTRSAPKNYMGWG